MSETDRVENTSKPKGPLRRFIATVANGLGNKTEVVVTVCSSSPDCPVVGTLAVRQAKKVLDDIGPWKLVSSEEL